MALPGFWEDLRKALTLEVAMAAAETELQTEASVAYKYVRLKELCSLHKVDWNIFERLKEAELFDENTKKTSFSLSLMQKQVRKSAHEATSLVHALMETNELKHQEVIVVLKFVRTTVSLSRKETEITFAKEVTDLNNEGMQELETEWQNLQKELRSRKSFLEHAIKRRKT